MKFEIKIDDVTVDTYTVNRLNSFLREKATKLKKPNILSKPLQEALEHTGKQGGFKLGT